MINNRTQAPFSISFYFFLILTFILIGRPQDVFPVLNPFRIALIFTVLALLTTFWGSSNIARREIFTNPLCRKYLLFYVIMIFGIPFAYHRRIAFDYIFLKYSVNMVFFWIFVMQVRSLQQLKKILFILVISAFFYGLYTLIQGDVSRQRIQFGTMLDPNDLAYFFVSFIPINLLFVVGAESNLKRAFCLINLFLSTLLIFMTGSRGGLIGLIVVFLLIFWSRLIIKKKSTKLIMIFFLAIFLVSQSSRFDSERFETFFSISEDYNISSEFGRLSLWKWGLKYMATNPITGVGVYCFPFAIGMERESQGKVQARWQVIHNSFLQIASETGFIGFFVFLSIVIACFRAFSPKSKRKMLTEDIPEIAIIKKVLFIGFAGHCVAGFFITQGYSIYFTLFFALAAVIQDLSGKKAVAE